MAGKQRAVQSDSGSEISDTASVWESALAEEDGEERETQTAGDEGQDDEALNHEEDGDDTSEPEEDEDGEEGDGEDDGEEGEDDDEEGEDDDSTPQEVDPESKIKVKINGEESEVTVAELRDGYSRTQDYTQKSQKLAEESRQVEAQKSDVLQQQQEWSSLLGQMTERLQAGLSGRTEAEWQQLRNDDELTYYAERENERGVQDRLKAMEEERGRVHQEAQQHQQKLMQQYAQQQGQELMAKVPEWSDKEVFAKDKATILDYGQQLGFSKDELANVTDHRAVLALRDAAKYRDLMAKRDKKAPAKSKTRTLKPGAPKNEPKGKTKARKAGRNHASQKSVKSAVDVFDSMLSQDD